MGGADPLPFGSMLEAVEHALEHARRSSYIRWERELPAWKGTALFYRADTRRRRPTLVRAGAIATSDGPQPAGQCSKRCVAGSTKRARGSPQLMRRRPTSDKPSGEPQAGCPHGRSRLSPATHPPRSAARAPHASSSSSSATLPTGRSPPGELAASLYALDRRGEADQWTLIAEELATGDDVASNMLWRQVRAKLLARRGEHAGAQRLAHEAVGLAEGTDMLTWHALALTDLADVYSCAGRSKTVVRTSNGRSTSTSRREISRRRRKRAPRSASCKRLNPW